jgi:hypothetical protein
MPTIHHCPICEQNIFKSSCVKKGHMWHCSKHRVWVRRDWKCVSCENEAEAGARNSKIQKLKEEKKGETKQEEKKPGRSSALRVRSSATTNGTTKATTKATTNGGASARRRA